MNTNTTKEQVYCYHCGEECGKQPVIYQQKNFCCEGCKMVYGILNDSGLCDYYQLSENPGSNQKRKVREGKFSFLDDDKIVLPLITYQDGNQTHITFYLPQIHCSSCLWLLENLYKINAGIVSSKVNFPRKETDIIFNNKKISLRQVAELLTSIGYEPHFSLHQIDKTKPSVNKTKIYKLGVAGFCFANIMMLSFPEYFGIDSSEEKLRSVFRILNLALSLPVFFYSASEFYISAWKGLKHRFLNIDVPIVLAIVITFVRSVYEVVACAGSGYFDSMSGIIFFMLAGRILQNKTYEQLSFERDYTSYFPLAVSCVVNDRTESISLQDIEVNNTLLIHNQELIPADGILTRGRAVIDYSFVTGETMPVVKEMGEIIYAGGKQTGSNIELLVIKEVAQSYLTRLWNRSELKEKKNEEESSFVHQLSRYFTWMVLLIAAASGMYWFFTDPSKIWGSVTAVMIIACPCALLLSHTFTNGNILSRLSRNKLYLRNAQVIEKIASVNHIVFDKTGTLTTGGFKDIEYEGFYLTEKIKRKIAALTSQSVHPMSKAITEYIGVEKNVTSVTAFKEDIGKGIEGFVGKDLITIGSKQFVCHTPKSEEETTVYIAVEEKVIGKFRFKNCYRGEVPQLIRKLKKDYPITILSGDNNGEKNYIARLIGRQNCLFFHQTPEDKLNKIDALRRQGESVMMLGDGLNDAGALKCADVGIAITDNCNSFSPASDGILEASSLGKLSQMIKLCRTNKYIILASFMVSVLYNIIGLFYAVQGRLSPVVAAILMPCSSISILLITYCASTLSARWLRL